MLRDLGTLRTEYTSDADNIAEEFYNPCLREAVSYDRITGFFSSTVFHLIQSGLEDFFMSQSGTMRILCSPRLSSTDADSLAYGYSARDNTELVAALSGELAQLLNSSRADTARLLAALVGSGRLDIRLARVTSTASVNNKRMFHDKVGIFQDTFGDIVGFRGSLNESYLGLSPEGNIESVDVWPSWEGGRDALRASHAVARFERLWEGVVPGVTVIGLPDEIQRELQRVAEDADLEALLRDLARGHSTRADSTGYSLGGIQLHNHQSQAIQAWEGKNRIGLLAHATGSGKTITGLYAIHSALRQGLTPLILVPSKLLLEQWAEQVRDLLGARVLLVGGGNNQWSRSSALRATIESGRRYVVIAVLNSASRPAFRAQLRPVVKNVFTVVDEAHRMGSPEFRTILDWLDTPWRLGLSATPERANDPEGTEAIFNYFGGVVHCYTLKHALDDGILAPYVYYPSWVGLTEDEQVRWDQLTVEIRRRYAISRAPGAKPDSGDQLRRKLIERARIAKGACNKVPKAADLVSQHYNPEAKQKWLIYCDNQSQMTQVRQALESRGVHSWEYHSQMAGDPEATLRLFDMSGGIIVAIKCLDEGVDIPSATHALILASSRNPREFIQRRGRILRRSPHKAVATLMDVLVLPESVDRGDPSWSLVVGELSRASEFAGWGIGQGAVSILEEKWLSMGLSLTQLDEIRPSGIEGDEDEEGGAADA
ncbi:DEAD/DEAH box helicase family protein [Streptomyces griseorubiginosus]|uniref:DEAD/DEAH box helicase family protein n=1 Tax=Streptomyces griseorubiginosus TaxID=67304 RepID=UPI0036B7FCC9